MGLSKEDIDSIIGTMKNDLAKQSVVRHTASDKSHVEVFDSLRSVLLSMDASDENDAMFFVATNKSDNPELVREDINTIIKFIDKNFKRGA